MFNDDIPGAYTKAIWSSGLVHHGFLCENSGAVTVGWILKAS